MLLKDRVHGLDGLNTCEAKQVLDFWSLTVLIHRKFDDELV